MRWNSFSISGRIRRNIAMLMTMVLAVTLMSTGEASSAKVRNRLYMVLASDVHMVSKDKGSSDAHRNEAVEANSDIKEAAIKGRLADVTKNSNVKITRIKKSLFSSGGSSFVTGVAVDPVVKTGLRYADKSQELLTSKGTVSDSGNVMVFSTNYDPETGNGAWSSMMPTGMDAKTYKIYYGSSTNGSTKPQYVGGPLTATIDKADWTEIACEKTTTYGVTMNLGFSKFMPGDGKLGDPSTYSDPNSILVAGSLETTDKNTLKYGIVNDSSKKGKSAIVQIPVTGSKNYNDYTLQVTLIVNSKEVPTITVKDIKKTYNGYAVTKSSISGTAKVGSTTVSGTWSFKDSGEYIDVSDSGKKTVKFTPSDTTTYDTVETIITVTISYKSLTITADDKQKAVGAVDPKFTASVSGLLSRDKDTIDYELSRSSGETAGTYTIRVEGEKYQGNYYVTYKNGTLRIGTTPTATPKATSTPKASSTPRPTSTPDESEEPSYSPKRTATPDEPLVETHTNKSGQDITTVTKVDEAGNQTKTKTVIDSKTGEVVSSTVTWISVDSNTGEILTESKTVKGNGKVTFSLSTEKESGEKVSATYRLKSAKNSTVIATGASLKGKEGTLIIPNTIVIHGTAYIVKGISNDAFRSNSTTEKVVIQDEITSIGNQAFCKSAVTSVTIGKGVKTIGEKAFLDAEKMKEIVIKAKNLKSIGKEAFKGTAEGLTVLIYADKKTYKQIVKMIMDSGKLPKKIKFKRKK